jgi:hypothetical protein
VNMSFPNRALRLNSENLCTADFANTRVRSNCGQEVETCGGPAISSPAPRSRSQTLSSE